MHVFYLHGFASSPRSSKAAFLATRLTALGLELQTPDFNQPEFSTLTITRMMRQVSDGIDALPPEPVALIGSSLGAFVAVQAALAQPARIHRLILLAPALDFSGNRIRSLGPQGLDEWKRTNRLDVFHYGDGRMMSVHYELYDDAGRYDCVNAALPIPIQIFQGRRDEAVDPVAVERWARARENVELHMLDDDHQLTASMEHMWPHMQRFLALGPERATFGALASSS
jgi:pimeloyl-ACP methyl ester carboxylesterase